jgi:hypothetical protein
MASAARASGIAGRDEEAAPLLLGSDLGQVQPSERARRRMEPRAAATAVVTLCLFLLAVSGLSVRRVLLTRSFGFGSGEPAGNPNLCSFAQLQRGLTMRHAGVDDLGGAFDPNVAADVNTADGLFFTAPGAALPMSKTGNGFACDAKYGEWLRHSALYTPERCELLTPPVSEPPFAPGAKILMVGNSYMFQQVTALVAQYGDHLDRSRCSSMARYWPSLSGEQRCACVGLESTFTPATKNACVDMFARRHWENPDGSLAFGDGASFSFAGFDSSGDGFYENMTGPPATAGVYRFKNGAELYMATNHPLMNSAVFGLDAIAQTLGVDLSTLDAAYLNPGNYEGFGRLFCGGKIDPRVVQSDGAEMHQEDILSSFTRAGFRGRLLLTGRKAEDDVSVLFRDFVAKSARGETPFLTLLVPFHMRLNKQFSPFVSGDMERECAGQPTCARKTCELNNLEGCSSGPGHACSPGFPDVSVNMFLHALRADVNKYYSQGW